MDDEVYAAIDAQVGRFEEQFHVRVSTQTRRLAAEIINSITEDPHPNWRWREDGYRLRQVRETYISAVPFMLTSVAAAERVDGQITAFDFLHWFSRSLELSLCIIPK